MDKLKGAWMLKVIDIDAEYSGDFEEDTKMVLAAQESPAGFKPLYQKWLKPVYRYFYFRLENEKDAEDLTSQVFLKVLEDLPRYHNRGSFPAWLFAIARARAIDFYRKQGRVVPLAKAEFEVDDVDLTSQTVKTDELRRVMSLIRNLPSDEQELLRLRFAADLNYREIGELLHRKEDSVRKAVSRILDRIKVEVNYD
jgi:RNA polymerase sigma-70 factor (ECF subfamily)